MSDLDAYLRSRPEFDLDELADATNALLPGLLPDDPVDARVKAEVNARLIRHYVGEGLLDPAIRAGRRAVYTVDHLLQLLALRRLLADGVPSTTIGEALRERGREELRAVAEGRSAPFAPTSSGPAVPESPKERARAALASIRAGAAASPRAPSAPSPSPSDGASDASGPPLALDPAGGVEAAERWERVPLFEGVELHVRSDVRLPAGVEARNRLLDHVIREIVRYAQRRDR